MSDPMHGIDRNNGLKECGVLYVAQVYRSLRDRDCPSNDVETDMGIEVKGELNRWVALYT